MAIANFLTALAATLDGIGQRWQAHSRNLIESYAAILATSGRRCAAPPATP